MAAPLAANSSSKSSTDKDQVNEIVTQLVISIALGLSAFLGFCVGYLLAYSTLHLLTSTPSSYDQGGRAFMPQGNCRKKRLHDYRSYQILFLGGSLSFTV